MDLGRVPSAASIANLNGRYGRLKWSTILGPAFRIARDGYRISKLLLLKGWVFFTNKIP